MKPKITKRLLLFYLKTSKLLFNTAKKGEIDTYNTDLKTSKLLFNVRLYKSIKDTAPFKNF